MFYISNQYFAYLFSSMLSILIVYLCEIKPQHIIYFFKYFFSLLDLLNSRVFLFFYDGFAQGDTFKTLKKFDSTFSSA